MTMHWSQELLSAPIELNCVDFVARGLGTSGAPEKLRPYFRALGKAERWRDLDVVIMDDLFNPGSDTAHIGLVAIIDGERWVLHKNSGFAARLDRAREIGAAQFRIRSVLRAREGGAALPPAAGGRNFALAALLILSFAVAGPVAGFLGAGAEGALIGTTFGTNLVGSALIIGGSFLLNKAFAEETGGRDDDRIEQYSVRLGRNRARPHRALPLVLGSHRFFPDLAALVFNTFEGNEDHFIGTYEAGIGDDLRFSDIRAGDYVLQSGEYEYAKGGAALSAKFLPHVDTLNVGAVLELGATVGVADWVSRPASANAEQIWLDVVYASSLTDRKTGAVRTFGLEFEAQVRARADASASPPLPQGAWTPALKETVQGDGLNTVRHTFKVTSGLDTARHYDVRFRITDAEPAQGEGWVKRGRWLAMRSVLAGGANSVEGVGATGWRNRLGVNVVGTKRVSGVSDRISVLAKQAIPTWNGTAWAVRDADEAQWSNPAAVFRAYARGWRASGGQLLYGLGLPAAQIDDAALQAWYSFCATRQSSAPYSSQSPRPQLRCDMVLQRAAKDADVLETIAQCGLGSVTWKTGKLGVIWAAPNAAATTIITPGNILERSFRVSGAPESEQIDEVTATFVDGDSDWDEVTIRRNTPSTGTERVASLRLRGIVHRDHAAMMANLHAAATTLRRRTFTWRMGEEGILINRGDVVALTHSLANLNFKTGRAARIINNNQVDLGPSAQGVEAGETVVFRRGNLNRVMRPITNVSGTTVTWTGAAITGLSNIAPEDLLWAIYDGRTSPPESLLNVRITERRPAGGGNFEFSAVTDAQSYYAAGVSDLTVALPTRQHVAVVVTNIEVEQQRLADGRVVRTVFIETTGPWVSGVVYEGDRVVARLSGGETIASWTAYDDIGEAVITVVPGSDTAPAGAALSETVTAPTALLPGAPDAFEVGTTTAGVRETSWTNLTRPDIARYELLHGPDGGSTTAVADMTSIGYFAGSGGVFYTPTAAGNYRFAVRAWTRDNIAGTPAYVQANIGATIAGGGGTQGPPGADGVSIEYMFTTSSSTAIGVAQLPNNDWGYRQPGTSGGQVYTQGATATSATRPNLFRVERRFRGSPAVGAAIPGEWSAPVLVGHFGIDGADGEDGPGYEIVFARTAKSVTAIPPNQLPLNSWTYDQQNGGFISVGGLDWYDGQTNIPLSNGPRLWACIRLPKGDEARLGAAVAAQWFTPFIWADRGDDGEALEFLWSRTERDVIPLGYGPNQRWGYRSPGICGYDKLTWTGTVARPSGQNPPIAVVGSPPKTFRRWAADSSIRQIGWVGVRSSGAVYFALHPDGGGSATGVNLADGVRVGMVMEIEASNGMKSEVRFSEIGGRETTAPYEFTPVSVIGTPTATLYSALTAGSTATVTLKVGSPSNYEHQSTGAAEPDTISWTGDTTIDGQNLVLRGGRFTRIRGSWAVSGKALRVNWASITTDGSATIFPRLFNVDSVGRIDDKVLADMYFLIDAVGGTDANPTYTRVLEFEGPRAASTQSFNSGIGDGYIWKPVATVATAIANYARPIVTANRSVKLRCTVNGGLPWHIDEKTLTESAFNQFKSQRQFAGAPATGFRFLDNPAWSSIEKVGSLQVSTQTLYATQ